jgi:predicted DNA-binding transcriptional regulator AlpA
MKLDPAAAGVDDAKARAKPQQRVPDRLLLTIDQVAEALNLSRRTAYTLRATADFPRPVTIAQRVVRYRASEVAAYVERLTADAAPPPEPERLRVGRQAKRACAASGSNGAAAAGPQPARALAEGESVEPKTAPVEAAARAAKRPRKAKGAA